MNLFSEEIGNGSVRVLKRGGNHEQDFDLLKIENAILKAFEEVGTQIEPTRLAQLAKMVKAKILLYSAPGEIVQVEAIQDLVETTLMETKYIQEARAYILYRSKHQQIREDRLVPDQFAVANYIHPGKYARYLPEEARREVYPETVDRVAAMHVKRFPHVEKEIREAFEYVSVKRVLPSMRSMQFAGEAIETVNARQYNCLGEETEFITDRGVKSFKDFEDGDVVKVLTHKGRWKSAEVKNFGKQTLYEVRLGRGRSSQTVRATRDHRWILPNGESTTDLSVGHKLHKPPTIVGNWVYEDSDPAERLYWAMGYVYGDGTVVKKGNGDPCHSMVRLCGDDGRFLSRFQELGFSWSKPPSYNGEAVAYTGKYFKTAPSIEEDGFENVVAFVRGYLDADGNKNSNYLVGGKSEFNGIQTSDLEAAEFIRNVFPAVGAYITREDDLTGQETNYGTRPETSYFGLVLGFADHPNSYYSAQDFKESSEEDVWCLVVEDDHSFVLPNGVVTGNCSFMHVDKMRAFGDTLYLLLCGTGVGYSIQYDHVEKLPSLKHIDPNNVRHHNIADTIEGWANALTTLMNSYVRGYYVEFNYSKIRAKGVPLKTSGGKAPGHLGLKTALESIRALLDKAQGRHLRPIECYDIMCHAADAVLSGGIRRSATIALFSLDDGEMMAAKTGNWFDIHPWRTNANNSAVLKRGDLKKKQFKRIFKYIQEFGEPGFVFTNDYDYGFNPCVEINLNPVLTVDEQALEHIELKRQQGYHIRDVKLGERLTGVAWCNLTEINAAAFKTPEDMYAAAVAAARIGTLQAAYTSFPYLGWVSEVIAEREALLGVSMTGMLDAPDIALNPEYQKEAALRAVVENKRFAEKLGIRNAARVTCVKPAGTTSLELGCVASGIHAHHARRYIRRVTANELEPVFQYFKKENGHMCVKKDDGDWVIEFPVSAPEGALVQDDLTALEFLAMVRSTQQNWVVNGIADPDRSPGACHNVSNTVVCKPEEWQEVAEYVWEHRKDFSGISFLPSTGDKDYAHAPREAISTEADEDRWNQLLRHYRPVDYTKMVEDEDSTNLTGEQACAGGSCSL